MIALDPKERCEFELCGVRASSRYLTVSQTRVVRKLIEKIIETKDDESAMTLYDEAFSVGDVLIPDVPKPLSAYLSETLTPCEFFMFLHGWPDKLSELEFEKKKALRSSSPTGTGGSAVSAPSAAEASA